MAASAAQPPSAPLYTIFTPAKPSQSSTPQPSASVSGGYAKAPPTFRQIASGIVNLILAEGPSALRRQDVAMQLYLEDRVNYHGRTIAEELARRSCDQACFDLIKDPRQRERVQMALATDAAALKVGHTAWVMASGSLTLENTLVQMAKQEHILGTRVQQALFTTIANMLAASKYESVQLELINHPLAMWYKTGEGIYVGTQLANSKFPSVRLGLLRRHPQVTINQPYSLGHDAKPIAWALSEGRNNQPEAIRRAADQVIEQMTKRPEAAPTEDAVQRAYTLLRLAPTATDTEVAKRYREFARQLHPDMWAARPADQQARATQWFMAATDARDTIFRSRSTGPQGR